VRQLASPPHSVTTLWPNTKLYCSSAMAAFITRTQSDRKSANNSTSEYIRFSLYNGVDSLFQLLGRAYQYTTFTGIREQFRPDALPVATNDPYGYQREFNPGSLGVGRSVDLTTEPGWSVVMMCLKTSRK